MIMLGKGNYMLGRGSLLMAMAATLVAASPAELGSTVASVLKSSPKRVAVPT